MVGTLNPEATGTVAAKKLEKTQMPHPKNKLINILSIVIMRKAGRFRI